MSVGVVVLSMGTRPAELAACLGSVRAQRGIDAEIVVVGNGWQPDGLPDGVRTVALAENIGISAGRNAGARVVTSEVVFFLDDDAWLDDGTVLAQVDARFAEDGGLGAVCLRLREPDGTTPRRWVPRFRVGDPARSGPAFTLAEGASVVRRSAFEAVGGWPGAFFYGHEGIDLTWRLWDAGWTVRYEADLTLRHPTTVPSRHDVFYRFNARNKVWVARRNLPAPLVPVYLGSWVLVTTARLARRPRELRTWWRGFVEGWRTDPGPRLPMRWRTVWRLTRLGQPPVI